jgi:hypothetical protein
VKVWFEVAVAWIEHAVEQQPVDACMVGEVLDVATVRHRACGMDVQ